MRFWRAIRHGSVSAAAPVMDPVEAWIGSVVRGRTFADIGGIGMDAANERITFAVEHGAAAATMIDIRPPDYYEWERFREICASKGISEYRELPSIDINDPELVGKVGTYDVVHCTGIFYHLPSPLAAFENLRRVVGEYLIINTVIAPGVIENRLGRLEFPGSLAVFLPGISEHERSVLGEHYRVKFGFSIDSFAPRISDQHKGDMPWHDGTGFTCWPYWWLLTASAFRALIELMGFQILDEWTYEDHALFAFARKAEAANTDGDSSA
jgi:SAM-dependent methyltransferase